MSRVEYFEYVADEDEYGKRFYKKVKVGVAEFLQFGVSYEEFETGAGNYSTAILKLDCGQVHMVQAELIKFIDSKTEG